MNPVYQSILDKLPESLHSVVLPELQKMDQGVERKLQEVRDEYKDYENYKNIVDAGVDPNYIVQSLQLAHELQNNPQQTLERINESWNLGYVHKEAAPSGNDDSDNSSLDLDGDDLTDNPVLKQMQQALEQMQQRFTEEDQKSQEQQAIEQFEQELDSLLEDKPHVNRLLITAFMSQGLTGQQSLEEYNKALAGTVQTDNTNSQTNNSSTNNSTDAPIVMGGDGTTGSGVPQDQINFGSLGRNDLNKSVEAMLAAAQESNQG